MREIYSVTKEQLQLQNWRKQLLNRENSLVIFDTRRTSHFRYNPRE